MCVEVREDWFNVCGVIIDKVIEMFGVENVNVFGGVILEGDYEYLVCIVGELCSVEDICSIQIR